MIFKHKKKKKKILEFVQKIKNLEFKEFQGHLCHHASSNFYLLEHFNPLRNTLIP